MTLLYNNPAKRVITDFIDWQIVHPATAQMVWVKWIEPADYQYYFDNGYQYLFEIETTDEPINDIPTTQPE